MNGPSINSSFELPATLGCSWKASLWLKCLILREFLWLGVSEVILYGTLNITLFLWKKLSFSRNNFFIVYYIYWNFIAVFNLNILFAIS